MPKYFFNVVLNGQPTSDPHGTELRDHHEAEAHAEQTVMLLAGSVRDHDSSFIAVSGEDSRLVFKVPFCRPRAHETIVREVPIK